ncbi:nuclear nucleic acid-binding protein C1D [Phlebotomus papatasi]|uniref:Nuclear nucleic acid-binding protein C1D n=1 Tax=Phlebotomus papatasi TaxID=29031 RepID=A0A1B0D5Z2_PHLPP|nr:nuclear nucleic acid-binding protein C1D [Phlebotomus papatasi]
MDFGELKNDKAFVEKMLNLDKALEEVDSVVEKALNVKEDTLTQEDRVKLDIFLSYALNSLYFIHLKLQGADVSEHTIKHELARVREAMMRQKQIHDKKTLMPRLNVPVAGRFVRNSLWEGSDKKDGAQKGQSGHGVKRKADH